MFSLQRMGGLAALYMAAANFLGIYVFLVMLDYPGITEAGQKLALVVERTGLLFATNLILYVLFGVALVVLMVALHDRMRVATPGLVAAGGAFGVIWAGSLVASGMVANAGMAPVIALQATNPDLAAQLWAGTEAVASGLGNGNGEVLGGMMALLFGWAGWRGGRLPRLAGLMGVVTGLIGLATLAPALVDLAGVFGILLSLWFIWLAVLLFGGDARPG